MKSKFRPLNLRLRTQIMYLPFFRHDKKPQGTLAAEISAQVVSLPNNACEVS